MPFDTPRLDDRTFDDIVKEALRRIPLYTPEWTDHNISDPGVALIELFAWMTDIILYRLNRVPDLHYIKLMELLGMRLREPEAAKTRATFWLVTPQPNDTTIPAETEVATTRTENNPAIVFSTDEPFTIVVPQLAFVIREVSKGEGKGFSYLAHGPDDVNSRFTNFYVFREKDNDDPQPDDSIYFGFSNNLSYHIVGLQMDVDPARGAGIDPTDPPYAWQVMTGPSYETDWEDCDVDVDGTKGFNTPGVIRIHLPKMAQGEVAKHRAYWLRCRILPPKKGVARYRKSPQLYEVKAASWGATIPATHASIIKNELLGRSDGSPGQRFYLQNAPILKRNERERILVRQGDNEQEWSEIIDFADSNADDLHYSVDNATGAVRFGPALPQRDGSIKRYGSIPPRGHMILMQRYRHGGGAIGNVQQGALNVLKTSIPYINKVANRQPAAGGLDRENLDDAKLRVPGHLRTLRRAVTGKDFEYLAIESIPGKVARAFAVPVSAKEWQGIKLVLIPHVNQPHGHIAREMLELDKELVQLVTDYLDERRLLTTKLDVTQPAYRWISAIVHLHASSHADHEKVEQAVYRRLYEFLNPIVGGFDGKGWPFGRDLSEFDVVASLQNIPGIEFVRSVKLFPVIWKSGGEAKHGDPEQSIEIVAHGVVVSHQHVVKID